MFSALRRWSGSGFRPARSDRELMESVLARLTMLGALDRPSGTVLRSIPGVIVKFLPMAGMVTPTVYEAGTDRPIGSIVNDKIVYVQPRSV